jgi:GMP synthase (glutamine-hydrolysing)
VLVTVKKILLVVHKETSESGLVGQILQANGYTLETCCPAIGEELPKIDAYDGAIVFGGPMSANDDEELPFIRAELNWIPTVLAAQKPFLGICLGGQMLARVLGAKVAPHAEARREIGYFPIQPTLNGHNPLAALKQVYHWHKEGFEVPQDAVLLATGKVFANQAFRYGKNAYGLQFHPEMTQDLIDRWTTSGAEQLQLPTAQSREEQLQNHAEYGPEVKSWLQGFLLSWLG